ncbi:MAG: MATE family efflux transporter [Cyanobacteria bacterium RM1_2_2]|nr:MATE family efflux transporter [Cyanobacteria bacterium RM1_2_2]
MTSSPAQTRLAAEIKACLWLAIPLAGAQLAQAATAFVDTIMMGWLGSATLAAGGLGASVFQALLLISTGIVSAVSPLVAAAYGGSQTAAVGKIVRQGLWLAAGLAMPMGLLLWSAQAWLPNLGQSTATINIALPYLRSIVWGVLPALGFAVLRNFVSALSDPRPVIVIMLSGTVFNILANYSLMFGKWGLPALGLTGIGLASATSLWGMFLALSLYILSQPRYRAYRVFKQLNQLEIQVLRDLIQVGIPIGVLAAVETGMFTLTTFLMGQLGTVSLAAHLVALQTAAVTFMVPLGISLATTVRVGQQLGQQNPAGARLAGWVGIGIAALFMSLMAILFWLFPQPIVALYLDIEKPDNAAVVALAKQLLIVAAVFQLFDGIQVSAAGALRGLKDTRIPMLIGIIAYWGIGLTSGYLLGIQLGWGGIGLWWGLAIGLAAASMVLTWRFSTTPIHPTAD